MVERLGEAQENMLALLRLLELVLGATLHHLLAVEDEGLEHALERERLRHAIDEREHVVVEGALELGVLIEVVEDGLRVRGSFELDDNADVGCGLITQILHAFELLVAHEVRDTRDEVRLVHTVRDGGDDDVRPLLLLNYLRLAAHDHAAATARVRMLDIGLVERYRAEREVRALHELKQVIGRRFRVVYQMRRRVHHLAQVMRRNVGGHTHSDTERAVKEQVRGRSWKHRWFGL